jgi:GNAT superfamily N-acetyltransferase
LARFIDVPWRILDRRANPQWVPPLRAQVADLLDDRRNPFYHNAARALFVAEDDGRPVGRIAAIENRAHNAFHEDRVGFFGFYESIDDADVATALLDVAAEWLGARGLDALRGPMSPSTNYDCGMLVDGFDQRCTFLTTWNPPYYPALMERAGMEGVQDLVAYFIRLDEGRPPLPDRFTRLVARGRRTAGITFRSADLKHFWSEVERLWSVYGSAWEENWGFVPVTHDEFRHLAKDLRHLLVEEFLIVAEAEGEPVGFLLVVPDYNEVLRKIGNGRLFPTGLFRLLRAKRRIRVGRVMAFGIRPGYRGGSILPLFFDELVRRGTAYGGVGTDASWILADNKLMRAPLDAIQAEVTRTWRIWERPIPQGDRP